MLPLASGIPLPPPPPPPPAQGQPSQCVGNEPAPLRLQEPQRVWNHRAPWLSLLSPERDAVQTLRGQT